jgi:hypothetical protein
VAVPHTIKNKNPESQSVTTHTPHKNHVERVPNTHPLMKKEQKFKETKTFSLTTPSTLYKKNDIEIDCTQV